MSGFYSNFKNLDRIKKGSGRFNLRHPVEEKYSIDASCKLDINLTKKQPGSVDIKKGTSNTC